MRLGETRFHARAAAHLTTIADVELRPTLTLVAVAPSLVAGDDLSLCISNSFVLNYYIQFFRSLFFVVVSWWVTYVYNSIAIQFRKLKLSIVYDDYIGRRMWNCELSVQMSIISEYFIKIIL